MFLKRYGQAFILRPRLMASILSGLTAYFFLPNQFFDHQTTRAIVGWDIGMLVYLIFSFMLMYRSNHESIVKRALMQVEGQTFILVLSIAAVLVSLFSIIMELSIVKNLHGYLKTESIILVIITILLSWFFIHVTFSLDYAHSFYEKIIEKKSGGLIFPGTETPDYFDFLYFSLIIGTSGQTADVSFSSQRMRRMGSVHCVLAFLFNTAILALSINMISSLV